MDYTVKDIGNSFFHFAYCAMCFPAIYCGLVFTLLLVLWCLSAKSKAPQTYSGKHILITGGSQGIGASLAKELAALGSDITLIARNTTALERAKAEVENCRLYKDSQRIRVVSIDITKGVVNFTQSLQAAQIDISSIDCLVNCAGFSINNYIEQLSEQDYQTMVNVNYLGSVYCTLAVLPHMRERKSGQIVFVSSQAGQVGFIGMTAYTPSKYAVRGFAESLRHELLPYNISISVLYPPDTDTPGFENENRTKPVETNELSESSGLFHPDKVAQATVKQMSTDNYSITVGVDGFFLDSVNSGLTPFPGLLIACFQVLFAGILRLVALGYSYMFDRIIYKHKNQRQYFPKHKKILPVRTRLIIRSRFTIVLKRGRETYTLEYKSKQRTDHEFIGCYRYIEDMSRDLCHPVYRLKLFLELRNVSASADGTIVELLNNLKEEIDGIEQDPQLHEHLITTIQKLSARDVLAFVTGSCSIPGCDWPSKPAILFQHDPPSSYSRVSTCTLTLTIPVTEDNLIINKFMLSFSSSLAHGATFW